jgi:hypothetical protein
MKKTVILLIYFISNWVKAQVASELSPKSLTLPRLSTAQQNTLAPQQAGNVVYNSDEKKLAVHDGNEWNYLSGVSNSQTSQYKNHKVFFLNSTFTVPVGVSSILMEAWGNGAPGEIMPTVGVNVPCSGGGGGQYVQVLASVTPNQTLDIWFDLFYNFVESGTNTLIGASHASGQNGGRGIINMNSNIIKIVNGENGKNATFSFQLANVGIYRKVVIGGDGGGTYPSFQNGGNSTTMEFDVNTGQFLGGSLSDVLSGFGVFPGGGGGCSNSNANFGRGAMGAVIFHY